jgi:hypothetical protein
VGITILLFMVAMVMVVSMSPESVPLCFSPSVTSAQTATASQNGIAPIRTVCPSGEDPPNGPYTRQPEGRNIRIVAGLGLVGCAVAAPLPFAN